MSGISFCGLDCGKCIKFKDIYAEKMKEILNSIKESELDKWQEHEPREEEFNYMDFKRGLEWFEKHMRCHGCKAGGGNPDCMIRECCKGKGVENCGKCSEFVCEKVRKFKEEIGIDVEKNFKGE